MVVITISMNVINKWLCCVLFGPRDPDTSSMTQGQSAPCAEKETKPWQHTDLSDIKQRVESWSYLWNETVIISKWSLKYLNKIISVGFQGPYECYLSIFLLIILLQKLNSQKNPRILMMGTFLLQKIAITP